MLGLSSRVSGRLCAVFSAPDPSVTRKSGILSPYLAYGNELGAGVGIPIFWALAPDYDLTFTPTYFSQQGFFAKAEWRQRLESGSYLSGLREYPSKTPLSSQSLPMAPAASPRAARWKARAISISLMNGNFGWEFTLLSDKWYLNDYHVPDQALSYNYISETTSTVYLTGQRDRGYFDLRGYSFEGLSSHDIQAQQPIAHPVWTTTRPSTSTRPNPSALAGKPSSTSI